VPPLSPEQASLVEQTSDRVLKIARSVHRLLPEVSVDDLQGAGNEGLVHAALRYDRESGVPFAAFAHYRIRGAMIDFARRQAPGMRRHQRAIRSLQAAQALAEQASGSGLADRRSLGDRVESARALVQRTAAAVLTARALDGDPERVAGRGDPESDVIAEDLRIRLQGILAALPPDDRTLIDAIYREGRSMHEIAADTDVATSTVSRRHAKLMSRLAGLLGG
jgi:RNA polymerase sigma factor for flagellar operon FliA